MTDQELEWRFIRARLIGHGMYLREELQNAIISHELIDSSRLVNTLTFRVNMNESAASGELVIDFYLYGRFQDMGAGRRSPAESSLIEELVGVRRKRRKKPWYNKTVFGTLNQLIYDLSNGFTDKTKAMLKSQILREALLSL